MRATHLLHPLLTLALTLPLCALAADSKGTLNVSLENDLFGKGSDKHYTHGTEVTYVSDTNPRNDQPLLARLMPWYDEGDETRYVVALGQHMYTPEDTERRDLILDDRPYAGWLYVSLGLLNESNGSSRHVDRLELILGRVGPDSSADSLQREIHRLTDSDYPAGWENQLDNEWTADLQYQRQWMLPLVGDSVDLVPQIFGSVGTSQRFAGLGLTLRIGSGLASDYGPPLIRPTASGSHYFKPSQPFYWYLFIGANGRYVDHNIFLDGNRDGNSHSVEREEWVGDAQAGLVLGWGNWRLALTNIIRSREFIGQKETDEFGALAVSYRL